MGIATGHDHHHWVPTGLGQKRPDGPVLKSVVSLKELRGKKTGGKSVTLNDF